MSTTIPPSTTASLNFLFPPTDGTRAYEKDTVDTPITGARERNFTVDIRNVEIQNLRGNEAAATLDTTGFQIYKHPAKHTAFTSDAEIEKEYYPESIEIIKRLTGASRVFLFDHTIRRRRPGENDDVPDRRQPVSQTHIDQTNASALARVHRHPPAEEVPKLLKHRFQILNLWRPISHPAVDWPLALCDFRTVDPANDILPIALIHPDSEGEIFALKYNPNQKWAYFSGVAPDELILFKCFDSLQDGSVTLYTPHTGFEDPATPKGTPLRESIELRALVFYD
ncbi:hypothetical protein DFH09DRAFT_1365823 [Mycena vulgaris]|nr:hypothetical protein DFH09DRAFT_1365823 [Mycena vulgaris]